MPLADAPCDRVDGAAIADVADLGVGSEFAGRRLQALASPGEKDAAPPEAAQAFGDRPSDPARSAGDYRDANSERVVTLISTVSSMGTA